MSDFQTNKVQIRKASHEDLSTLLAFEQAIIDFERCFDPTLKSGKIHYYDLAGMINAKQVELLVACYQNKVIGSGFAQIISSEIYLRHKKNGYLGFMYVRPDWRGKGINQLIVKSLIDWSQSQGVDEIRLDVYADNIAAINAYQKIGFRQNLLEMRLAI